MEMVCKKNTVINNNMFFYKEKILDKNLINKINKQISKKYYGNEKRFFNNSGKEFFFKNLKQLKLLREIIRVLLIKTDLKKIDNLFIDHTSLLIKSTNGNKTLPHQDISYWEIESKFNMFTVWIPLEDINKNNGALKLNSVTQTKLMDFNKKEKIYKHNIKHQTNERFIKEYKNLDLKIIEAKKGSIIFFDSYEIHSSTLNNSKKHRKAMKIVFRNGQGAMKVLNLVQKFNLTVFFFIIKKLNRWIKSLLIFQK